MTLLLLGDPVVDWDALLEVVWTSLLGGIGVTGAFAVGLLGAVRTVDARNAGRTGASTAYVVMTVLAAAVVLASVVFAITVIKTK